MDIDIKKNNTPRALRKGVVDLRAFEKERLRRRELERKMLLRESSAARTYADIKLQEELPPERIREEEGLPEIMPETLTGPTEPHEAEVAEPIDTEEEPTVWMKYEMESRLYFGKKRTAPDDHNFVRPQEMERYRESSAIADIAIDEEDSIPLIDFRHTNFLQRKSLLRFATVSFMIPVLIFGLSFAQSQYERKERVLGASTAALNDLKSAAGSAFASEFNLTGSSFESANMNFAEARETIDGLGLGIGEVIAGLPIDTPLSAAENLTTAGENISLAGKDLSGMLEKIATPDESISFVRKLVSAEEDMKSTAAHLSAASANLEKVETRYIPEDMRSKIDLAKDVLPSISSNFEKFAQDYPLLLRMLGSERTQKYLLLFENNSEMRANGGFIGTYGILDIKDGEIESLTIDGIFNPDGQLREKIVPPMPVQKISAAWSMHDANWFADYPTSARKIALLYEKTGGPTVDGVIAITPETVKKLLAITGPIEMPEYGVIITADNFIAETQNQVENLYDQEENRPKKILSDLAPILLKKVSGLVRQGGAENLLRIIRIGEESLDEKHILIYHRDEVIETMIKKRGWGGEVIQNRKGDYLSVINSNINGYKTDAVIKESIRLETNIGEDGTVINTLVINRKHLGGDAAYDWYNRVNADYMRVYVPQGSILLEASGSTAEEYSAPIDYSAFKTDPDIKAIEDTIRIDPKSGTQVFEEAGKTVFGNWVYVSPKEEVTVVYRYELPFKIDFAAWSENADAYSALVQKQAGSVGSDFETEVRFPDEWQIAWKTEKLTADNAWRGTLSEDMLYGIVLTKG